MAVSAQNSTRGRERTRRNREFCKTSMAGFPESRDVSGPSWWDYDYEPRFDR